MKPANQVHGWSVLLMILFLWSCSPLPHLKVNYGLPSRTEDLKGTKVFLVIEDMRSKKDILGPGGREEFPGFSGNLSFSVSRGTEPGFKVGVYDLLSLYRKACEKRLENEKVRIVTSKKESRAELRIVLQEFYLDLAKRKWKVRVAYEARLIQDGNLLAKQMVSAEGERLKLIGQTQADELLSEIFTDTLNKLNLDQLFRQGGLKVGA
jgi:uncharacterized protein YdaU (DUF1376 family)